MASITLVLVTVVLQLSLAGFLPHAYPEGCTPLCVIFAAPGCLCSFQLRWQRGHRYIASL